MREILFRGKTTDKGDWVYGDLTQNHYDICDKEHILYGKKDECYISSFEINDFAMVGFHEIEVIPETVGQFTGLIDKNGTKIFEGDLCLCDRHINDRFDKIVFEIKYDECRGFYGENFNEIEAYEFCMCEIVGNIYDNPELLKGE